jgi:hypothetical protein
MNHAAPSISISGHGVILPDSLDEDFYMDHPGPSGLSENDNPLDSCMMIEDECKYSYF